MKALNTIRKIQCLNYFKSIRFFSACNTTIDSKYIEDKLKQNLKDISKLNIADTSGGCGQAFVIEISSSDFQGKSTIQQHRLINGILKEELKSIHSLQLKTYIPEGNNKI